VKDVAIQLGDQRGPSAILSLPDRARSDLAIIILNAGLVHRVGPFRQTVLMARRLASMGFLTMRVDLSGLGYSPARIADTDHQAVSSDVADAIRYFEEKHDISRFVLCGLCSGALDSHNIAVAFPNVVGAVLLDSFAYPTWKSRLRHYSIRILNSGVWRDWARRRLYRLSSGRGTPEVGLSIWQARNPSLEKYRMELSQLMARRVKLLFVYAGISGVYNYERQIFDCVPAAHDALIEVRIISQADHTFTLEQDRNELLDCVSEWFDRSF
jgi:pimeloyl-ACP methyl ester carboxylesterase